MLVVESLTCLIYCKIFISYNWMTPLRKALPKNSMTHNDLSLHIIKLDWAFSGRYSKAKDFMKHASEKNVSDIIN
jgi:hypothetical protein